MQSLQVSAVPGGGARGLALQVSWSPPATDGGALRTDYVVEVRGSTGEVLHAAPTGTTASGPVYGDYCLAPFTVSVHAVDHDVDGNPSGPGPAVLTTFGEQAPCAVTMSITAARAADGTVHVRATREAPVDPYVSGPCTLTTAGRVLWSGTCGGRATTQDIVVGALPPGPQELALTTVAPRGERATARTVLG
ncbi:hypothetical protein [Pseudonocardia sp. ICBG1293]|uniref:hypothetical protein n=1 Tax=Pseudonocardia sp. ICBG1293 TaxID=2844382 RepID=UPI001CCF07AC|nr:hypothetical protein [Pseudonocardia sp. ICBG1293]